MTNYKQIESDHEFTDIFLNHTEWLDLVYRKGGKLTEEEMALRGDLTGRDLRGYEFKFTNLAYMCIKEAEFNDCRFIGVGLFGVDARNTDFTNCHFIKTDFKHGCFYESDFTKSSINTSKMHHSFFYKANFQNCTFTDVEAIGAFLMRTDSQGVVVSSSNFNYAHVDVGSPFQTNAHITPVAVPQTF